MAEIVDMIVEFDKFCKDCEYYKEDETFEKCAECLQNPVNQGSIKPVMFKERDGVKKENK
ncbi:MAG: hypothetical protein J6U54_24225 [Clostridiales bacterium]|nr:hypothetical protein [Clostridiales bacterium]